MPARSKRMPNCWALTTSKSPHMILSTDRNIWRRARAKRVALLIDAASYFGALRDALFKARSSVFVIGWDVDRRTRLVDESGTATDGYPERFIDLLTALVKERPASKCTCWFRTIRCFMRLSANPSRACCWVAECRDVSVIGLDNDLPAGASHHQKIVMVDGELQ